MATPLQNGIDQGLASIRTIGGQTVTYARGPYKNQAIIGVRGSSKIETADADGASIIARGVDWLFKTADLKLPNPRNVSQLKLITPQQGDRITTASGEIYEVQSVGGDAPSRYSDPEGTHTRCHTRRVQA